MNYSNIQLAREKLVKYENDYQELVKKVNLSLYTLAKTNLSAKEKRQVWNGLSEYTKNIIRKVEEILNKLEGVRFSGNEIVLYEEKDNLTEKYRTLIKKLNEEKETVLRQIEKKAVMVSPFWQKVVKTGYCHSCDVSIAGDFPYKLKLEEQKTAGIEIAEGAAFCSQECLLKYCKDYKEKEERRQEKEKESKRQIEQSKKVVTEVERERSNLTERINRLESRELELELVPESDQPENPDKIGFFGRLGQKLGLIKKPNPLSRLERVKKLKGELKVQLKKVEEKLQRSLVILSVAEQKEKQRKNLEEKILLEKARIITEKEEERYD